MNAGRTMVDSSWIECEACGRIDLKPDPNNSKLQPPAEMDLCVEMPCERCGRLAKMHLKRELKPLQ